MIPNRSRAALAAVAAMLAVLVLPGSSNATTASATFSDQFSGTKLSSQWQLTNPKRGCQSPSNVWVQGGYLHLRDGQVGTHQYCGAQLAATPLLRPGIEVQIRAAFALPLGTHVGAVLYGTKGSWPYKGELDVDEMVGKRPTIDHVAAWSYPAKPGAPRRCGVGTGYASPTTFNKTWHVYAVDWQPGYIIFKVDGRAVLTVTLSQIKAKGCGDPFNNATNPFRLYLTSSVGGTWAGPPSGPGYPAISLIDWITVTRVAS